MDLLFVYSIHTSTLPRQLETPAQWLTAVLSSRPVWHNQFARVESVLSPPPPLAAHFPHSFYHNNSRISWMNLKFLLYAIVCKWLLTCISHCLKSCVSPTKTKEPTETTSSTSIQMFNTTRIKACHFVRTSASHLPLSQLLYHCKSDVYFLRLPKSQFSRGFPTKIMCSFPLPPHPPS